MVSGIHNFKGLLLYYCLCSQPLKADPYGGSSAPIATPPPLNRALSFQSSPRSAPSVAETGGNETPVSLSTCLSMSNLRKRVGRMMKPKCDGNFKVPKELVHEWNHGDQQKMLQEFQQAGLDKDPWGLSKKELWSHPYACIISKLGICFKIEMGK